MRPQNPPQVNRSREKPFSVLWLRPYGHLGPTLDPCRSCDFCRVPGSGCLVREEGASHTVYSKHRPSQSPTYSTRWGWTPSAGRRSSRWPRGCAPGTPAAPACSSGRCPSRLCAARCRRSSASGCPHSRCCQRMETPFMATHPASGEDPPQSHLHPGSQIILPPDPGEKLQRADKYSSQGLIRRRE